MAYRSKLIRLVALFAIIGLVTTPSYAQDGGADLTGAGDAEAAAGLDIGEMEEETLPDKEPKEIDDNERIRRRRQLTRAHNLIKDADDSYQAVDYIDAIDKYTQAEKILRDVSQSTASVLEELKSIRKTLGKCYHEYAVKLVEMARDEIDVAKFDQAESNLTKSIEFDPSLKPQVQFLIKVIEQQREQAEIDRATMAENIDPEYRNRLKEILIKKAEGKVFLKHRVWKRARNSFEDILIRDPGNEEAIASLKRLYDELREAAKLRRRAAEAERMAEIEWKWIDPIAPRDVRVDGEASEEAGETVERALGGRQDIHSKMAAIIITKISFEETPVRTVFEYLKNRSRVLDPDGIGVNFLTILRPKSEGDSNTMDAVTEEEEDFFADDDDDDAFGADAGGDAFGDEGAAEGMGGDSADGGNEMSYREPTITMDFDNIPLSEAVRYICEQAGLRYKVEDYACIILGPNVERGNLELRFFPIDPRLFTTDDEEEGGDLDFQQFFDDKGVSFPVMESGDKASISYDRGTSKLIVRNTPENLRLMERILKEINNPIPQVTIESKFIEVRQNALEELSFKWAFAGYNHANGRLGHKDMSAGNTRVNVHGNAYDSRSENGALAGTTRSVTEVLGSELLGELTSGAANVAETFSETLMLDTIIGNSQFQTMVYFMDRKDGTDVLSAPKITVQSGEEAFISMIEERMFPESFDEPEFSVDGGYVNFTPSSPVFGEAREDLGVTLTVTPQVAQDGISISLELHPKVVAFMGYDTTFNSYTAVGGGVEVTNTGQSLEVPAAIIENLYNTPIFEVRELRTKVTVWDGESVVLGGTITDNITKINDKVPVLGDLPLIGRLFQSKGESSTKKNLLMFVSARIIDPSGIPRREHDIRGLPDFRR